MSVANGQLGPLLDGNLSLSTTPVDTIVITHCIYSILRGQIYTVYIVITHANPLPMSNLPCQLFTLRYTIVLGTVIFSSLNSTKHPSAPQPNHFSHCYSSQLHRIATVIQDLYYSIDATYRTCPLVITFSSRGKNINAYIMPDLIQIKQPKTAKP